MTSRLSTFHSKIFATDAELLKIFPFLFTVLHQLLRGNSVRIHDERRAGQVNNSKTSSRGESSCNSKSQVKK